jgi:hypothetical protein
MHRRGLVAYSATGITQGTITTTTVTRTAAFPSAPKLGQFFVLNQGAGQADIVYVFVKWDDDTNGWLEVGFAMA